ncbi:sugar transferase [Larkinella terrae]|uniref:Sugar transferase n=1 Tax=Larkinella terrae TaxID=2025311 RepID=A0A7K0EUQ2_9BACT|nr:sugar transferase [Larkinella terrae]MRS65543.1 sugar transferase [Larkinella terrae]
MLTYHDSEIGELYQEEYVPVQTANTVGKRVFDLIVASLVIILFLSWLLPLFGLLIKLSSPGPMFYTQVRTGHKNRPFLCFKLRTMVDSDSNEFQQAVPNDPRITPVGKWMRKRNFDELPQFFNVLRGEMSIVGPRPHAIMHDSDYWLLLPDYHKRYSIVPGITGLAQARGARGLTDSCLKMQHRLRYDLFYIKKRSFLLDARIFWWTLVAMCKGDKNAG